MTYDLLFGSVVGAARNATACDIGPFPIPTAKIAWFGYRTEWLGDMVGKEICPAGRRAVADAILEMGV